MKKNVLLIDDSVTIHRVIDLSIDNEKYEVTKVFSKEDAALKLTEKLYDFILLDNKLDNIVITEYIPFLKGRSVGCRVILLVGAFDKFDVADLEKSGGDDYLVKPFDSQSLNSKLAVIADEDADDSDILEQYESIAKDNGEGVMAANFVDGLAIADAMREEPSAKKGAPKPINDGLGVPSAMLTGTQYLASLESEENVSEDDEGYHEEQGITSHEEPATDDGDLVAMLNATEDDDMHNLLGALNPAATIHEDGDITSEEASALEFLENENMKALPATEDDIDNAQYAEDTLVGLEYMDPMISGDEESDQNATDSHTDESDDIGDSDDENADHIHDEKEIARIYGLDEDNNGADSDDDFGLTADSFDTLPFDDTEEVADEQLVKDDSAFDEFEQCLEVMGADLSDYEAQEQPQDCECNDEHSADAPHDEASGAGEAYQPQKYSDEKVATSNFANNTAQPTSPLLGGITVTISREEIMALIGQAIDKRFLEETIKTVLTENLREVIRTIVPAIAEKYIKEEIERLKDE